MNLTTNFFSKNLPSYILTQIISMIILLYKVLCWFDERRFMKEELIEVLKSTDVKDDAKAVVMPHFCIDNIISYDKSIDELTDDMKRIISRGGGNLVVKQNLQRGGKAANLASALASLGIKTYLTAKTNPLGFEILKHFLKGKDVDLSHVSTDGELAVTSAVELKGSNVMISDPGSLISFSSGDISGNDEKLIAESEVVCISDWGLNERGTELARHVFGIARENGKKAFFDPGDPSPKLDNTENELNKLYNEVISGDLVDMLSVNEDEVLRYGLEQDFDLSVNNLKKHTRIDLHTSKFSRSISNDEDSGEIPVFEIDPKRLTGAGDSWNAGNLFGELAGLKPEHRMLTANAVAGYYISSPGGAHPSKDELIKFIWENKNID